MALDVIDANLAIAPLSNLFLNFFHKELIKAKLMFFNKNFII